MKVFLTGASSGIGEALAKLYAARGDTLGLVARRADRLSALRASLGVACETYPCDVRDGAAMKAAGADFIAKHGVPDLVVGNAGVSWGNDTAVEADAEVFREMMDINVLGLVHTFHPFVEPLRAKRAGTLAGIASVAGIRGLPGSSAYAASKAAAISYLEGLRLELRGTGVKVCTICPGFIDTPMTQGNPYPMPFLLSAQEAARRFVPVMDRGASYAIVPWQMAILGRVIKVLPDFIFDRAAAGIGRKPRKGEP